MALYVPAMDIWKLPPARRASLQPGQWVRAGPQGPLGRYMGQGRAGSDVVAWRDNARGRQGYGAALRRYAKQIG